MPAASVFGLTDKFPVGIDARHFKNQEAQESIVGIVKERDTYLHNTKALVISPVEDLRVKPDMILAYGYPGQISVLCKCFTWRGIPVTGKFLGSVGCSSIVWSFINQQPVMNIMAGGERGFSHTGDSEVSIVFPGNQLLDTAEAVIGTQKANVNHYPALTRHLYKEPVLLNNYRISYREIN